MQNYRGWFRVGVVLSAVWLLVAGGYVGFHYYKESEHFTTVVWETRNEGQWAVVGQDSFLLRCESKRLSRHVETFFQLLTEAEPKCNINPRNVALLLVSPLAIVWLFVALVVRAVPWIRAGFKRT